MVKNMKTMDDLYWRYGAKPVTVNAKMQYRPSMDSIVYVEGMRSVKVERWQIEYYADVLSGYLNVAEEREGGYYELICKLLEQPQFWVYFSEEERTEMLDKMINDEEFARNIERRYGEEDKPAIYVYNGLNEWNHYRFVKFEIRKDGLWRTLNQAFQFMNHRDHLAAVEYVDASDDNARREAIIAQLLQDVKRLYELGMTEQDIVARMRGDDPTAVHRLIVSNDYKLYVSRYYNQEIKMSPLDKAVYLLFLRHPEGINFSYLPDYREELMEIYKKLMNYRTTAAMLRSVEDVTDPTKNSINEKCARIRRAFVEALGSYKGEAYCISGPRGQVKKIALDRRYVSWKEL